MVSWSLDSLNVVGIEYMCIRTTLVSVEQWVMSLLLCSASRERHAASVC